MAHRLSPVLINKANRQKRYTELYKQLPAGCEQAIDSRHAEYVRGLFARLRRAGRNGREYNIFKSDNIHIVRRIR